MKRVYLLFPLFFLPILGAGCCPYLPMHEWENEYMMNYGFGHGGMFMWIIFLIVLGVAIYFIINTSKSKDVVGSTQEAPLDILKKRYAKGEITKEEFNQMKKDLE